MIDEPLDLPVTADERSQLSAFLEWHRLVLTRKCAGLSDEQLRTRAVASSNLTLLGLMRHLAGVERWYFQCVMDAGSPPGLFTETDDVDEDFNHLGHATGESTLALWREQVEQSRRIAAGIELDAVVTIPPEAGPPLTPGRQYTARWVLTHMIDEYARHNGHADLIREAIDGEVGE